MNSLRTYAATAVAILGLAAASWPQGMMRPPHIPGAFNPILGSGAEYQITSKGRTVEWAMAVVGKETVDGADGYWLEMRTEVPQGGRMIMKELIVPNEGGVDIKRMIMQMPGRPPMEMPVGMMSHMQGRAQQQASGPNQGRGELVGTESVTVPAGAFDCQHFRSTTDAGTSDVWASTKVAPYGMVKMTSGDTTMVLEKVLENEKSQIQGEPQKMEFPGMPQGGGPPHDWPK